MSQWNAGTEEEFGPGTVRRAGPWAVGNIDGHYFAVGRRCRHFGADLSSGHLDAAGCLVCPWHGASYDVTTGRMRRGPQGMFAKVPGLDTAYRALSRLLPLPRATVTVRNGEVVVTPGQRPP